jgi:integrase
MVSRRARGAGNLVARGPNEWFIRVDYGRDPTTGSRQRRSKVFRGTKTAAQKELNRLLHERDHAGLTAPDRITVAEWLTTWLARHHAEGHIVESVASRYAGIIRKHIVPAIGHMKLRDVRTHHVQDLKHQWLASLRPSTVHKQCCLLRQALEDAFRLEMIPRNPAAAVANPSVATGREERRALTEEEILLLLDAASGTRFEMPIRFALATGVRQGEMLSLLWTDVDLDAGLVQVRGTKTANSRRSVEVSAAMVQRLRSHRAQQEERAEEFRGVWVDHGFVFPSLVGTRWAREPFYRDFKTLLGRSGIDDPRTVTWHTLRHTAATQWIKHGIDIFTASRRLGHASASFTMDRYGHLLPGQQKAVAEALDYLIG